MVVDPTLASLGGTCSLKLITVALSTWEAQSLPEPAGPVDDAGGIGAKQVRPGWDTAVG